MAVPYHIFPLGDHAITIELENIIDEEVNEQCLSIADLLFRHNITGVKDIVTAYSTVSVIYDPSEIYHLPNITSPYRFIRQQVETVLAGDVSIHTIESKTITIPACFDALFAPDLLLMTEQKHISTTEFIQLFTSQRYRVYLIGFLPGFAYMGKVDNRIAMPRKEKPVPITPGSIAVAGHQAGIYPLASPGGWNIIGRTPLSMFDPHAKSPCRLKAGDHVIFEAISTETFHQLNEHL